MVANRLPLQIVIYIYNIKKMMVHVGELQLQSNPRHVFLTSISKKNTDMKHQACRELNVLIQKLDQR